MRFSPGCADQGHQLFITEACALLGEWPSRELSSSKLCIPTAQRPSALIQSIQPEEWQVPFDTKGCVQKFPWKEQSSVAFFFLPQCKVLNPFILEGDDIVILWFLFKRPWISKWWCLDWEHSSIAWELITNADWWVLFLGVQHRNPGGWALEIAANRLLPGDSMCTWVWEPLAQWSVWGHLYSAK